MSWCSRHGEWKLQTHYSGDGENVTGEPVGAYRYQSVPVSRTPIDRIVGIEHSGTLARRRLTDLGRSPHCPQVHAGTLVAEISNAGIRDQTVHNHPPLSIVRLASLPPTASSPFVASRLRRYQAAGKASLRWRQLSSKHVT